MKKMTLIFLVFSCFSMVHAGDIILELNCSEHVYFINPQEADTTKPAIETTELIIGNEYQVHVEGQGGYQTGDYAFPGVVCSFYNGENFQYKVVPIDSGFTFRAGKPWFAAFVVDYSGLDNIWGSYTITLTTNSFSAVDDADSDVYPVSPEISQNYPNPFNSSTKIEYTLKEQSGVRVDIFNVSGQLVKTLINEIQSAGIHSTQWDGFDNSNIKVSSGQYYYQIKFDDSIQTKKMMLVE
ncbi:T9SS type A sorting domain-containing protein [bacterium]|nr:T9SS type A sorting domain-containing protein [bacterium]